MLREVILYDELKTKFGGPYKLDIATPGEAIRALSANFKEFAPTIREGSWSLVMGDLETGDTLNDKTLDFTFGNDVALHIMPAADGRKNSKGLFAVIIGTVLLAVATAGASLAAEGAGVGLAAGFSSYAIGSAGLGITWGSMALMGAGMLLTGITSLLTAKQTAPQTGPTTASYLLNGPQQNTAQGAAIPLIFGRFRVGSSVVSTRLQAVQISVGADNYTQYTVSNKGKTIPPGTPPSLVVAGMEAPNQPSITDALSWQYPYPYYG